MTTLDNTGYDSDGAAGFNFRINEDEWMNIPFPTAAADGYWEVVGFNVPTRKNKNNGDRMQAKLEIGLFDGYGNFLRIGKWLSAKNMFVLRDQAVPAIFGEKLPSDQLQTTYEGERGAYEATPNATRKKALGTVVRVVTSEYNGKFYSNVRIPDGFEADQTGRYVSPDGKQRLPYTEMSGDFKKMYHHGGVPTGNWPTTAAEWIAQYGHPDDRPGKDDGEMGGWESDNDFEE